MDLSTRILALGFASSALVFAACASTTPPARQTQAQSAKADHVEVISTPLFKRWGLGSPAVPLADLTIKPPIAPSPLLALTEPPTPNAEVIAIQSKCNEQKAQSFLMRSAYVYQPGLSPEEKQNRKKLHRATIAWRTVRYGRVEGFGDETMNSRAPYDYAGDARFFGLNIRMNRRVLVALGCVEESIKQTCSHTPYVPKMLDGLRSRNTFHNNEVSNHLFGIAIDIDPDRNACCHCVAPAKDAPICKKPAKTPFDHAEIPACWVDAFERFGFYWLGRDELEDTMHFEFLGDPDRIVASSVTKAGIETHLR